MKEDIHVEMQVSSKTCLVVSASSLIVAVRRSSFVDGFDFMLMLLRNGKSPTTKMTCQKIVEKYL